ncbi:M14 family zinc carboxypeptidase [Botrimarina sp.]|uniref:M14 family zinc carboxypeptidase n=1 Tax=Botrimarina sp. TaxID=2795802 RepID=UPI0032ED328E
MDWQDLRRRLDGPPRAGQWRHAQVEEELDRLESLARQSRPGARLERSPLGLSGEGRRVDLVRVGRGTKHVLGWTQMHGDEPTHTSAVFALLDLLIRQADDPAFASILERCTLWFVPLLNPDGAQRDSRYNAAGIDLNRDARHTATAEGRMLKQAAKLVAPEYALNLHNQNHRKRPAGDPRPTRMAVLAPPVDASLVGRAGSQPPNLAAAKRLAGAIAEAACPLCEGRLTRYGADYTPTAFGEWFQASGATTVLLESGGIQHGDSPTAEELQLFSLLTGLSLIAHPETMPTDSSAYTRLKEVASEPLFDVLVRGVWLARPGEPRPAGVDLGINYPNRSAARPDATDGVVEDLGDLADRYGIEELDCRATPHAVALPLPAGAVPEPTDGAPVDYRAIGLEAAQNSASGTVRRGAPADLVIAQVGRSGAVDRLLAVIVAGRLAWNDSQPAGQGGA